MAERLVEIAGVLERAERVHAEVSAERNGVDPDWPLFYAWWLVKWSRLPELLGATPSQAELAFELIRADRDYRSEQRTEPWSSFYAQRLVERGWE